MNADNRHDTTCPECGGHVSTAWRRVTGPDTPCQACASRTDRNRTRDHVGPDLAALRDRDTAPYTEATPPRENGTTVQYGGSCSCRYCRTYLHSGRMTLWHLPECRLDLFLAMLEDVPEQIV